MYQQFDDIPRPLLVSLLAILLQAQAVISGLVALLMLAVSGDSSITVEGVSVTMQESRWWLFLTFALLATLVVWLGRGLWNGRPIARRCVWLIWGVLPFVVVAAVGFHLESLLRVPPMFLLATLLWWYLFRKPNVRHYFGDLDGAQDPLREHMRRRAEGISER